MYGTSLSDNVPITQPWEITEDILCLPFINICIEGSERMNGLLVSGWPAQEGPCGSTRPADSEIRAWQDGLFLKACSEEERYFVKSSFEKSLDSNADCWAEWQTVVHLHLKMNFSSEGDKPGSEHTWLTLGVHHSVAECGGVTGMRIDWCIQVGHGLSFEWEGPGCDVM